MTTLADCPIGLFISASGEICLKTEYGDNRGRIDAYIVSSGEFFWGSAPQTVESQRAQIVMPVDDIMRQAREMRLAIDMIEIALMGFGDLVDLPRKWGEPRHPADLRISLPVNAGQVYRVCDALSECTRIINSDDYHFALSKELIGSAPQQDQRGEQ